MNDGCRSYEHLSKWFDRRMSLGGSASPMERCGAFKSHMTQRKCHCSKLKARVHNHWPWPRQCTRIDRLFHINKLSKSLLQWACKIPAGDAMKTGPPEARSSMMDMYISLRMYWRSTNITLLHGIPSLVVCFVIKLLPRQSKEVSLERWKVSCLNTLKQTYSLTKHIFGKVFDVTRFIAKMNTTSESVAKLSKTSTTSQYHRLDYAVFSYLIAISENLIHWNEM